MSDSTRLRGLRLDKPSCSVYNLHRPFRSKWFVGFLVTNMQITYGVLSATHTTAALDGGSGIGRGHFTGDRHSTCLIRRSLWTSGVTVCGCSTLGESELRGPGQRFAVAARASMATVHQVVVSTGEASCGVFVPTPHGGGTGLYGSRRSKEVHGRLD